MVKTKILGRSGLELSPFGLLAGEDAKAPAPPDVPNWCDIPIELPSAKWAKALEAMKADSSIMVRVGPKAWDRTMMTACTDLLQRIGRTAVDVWQLSMLDLDRVKAGEPFRMMLKLRELGQVRFFSMRLNTLKDALWAVEHSPVHCITLDLEYEKVAWGEILKAADEAGTGVIATMRTTNGDVVRARELLASTSISAFSWPARLH